METGNCILMWEASEEVTPHQEHKQTNKRLNEREKVKKNASKFRLGKGNVEEKNDDLLRKK